MHTSKHASHGHTSLDRALLRFHLDEKIEIAVRSGLAARDAAEHDNALRVKGINDALDDVFDNVIVDDAQSIRVKLHSLALPLTYHRRGR